MKYGYTFGPTIEFRFNKTISMRSGIMFSNKGYAQKDLNLTIFNPYYDYSSVDIHFNFHYLDIPLVSNFSIGKKRVKFISSTGVAFNLLLQLKRRDRLKYLNGEVETSRNKITSVDFNRTNVSVILSMGCQIDFSKNSLIRIAPNLQYALLPLIGTDLKERHYAAGLSISFLHRIIKKIGSNMKLLVTIFLFMLVLFMHFHKARQILVWNKRCFKYES